MRAILVHGTPGSATDWNGYLADPPAGVEVLAIDRPGFGCSDPWAPVPELSRQVAALEPLLRRPLRNSNRELKYQRRELEELAPLLDQVTCPVIIVHGTRDHLVSYANSEYLRDSLTGAASVDLVALEGVDHFIIWSDEETVRASIRSLLGAVGPGTALPSR